MHYKNKNFAILAVALVLAITGVIAYRISSVHTKSTEFSVGSTSWLKFDEGSGPVAVDSSSLGHNGTITGATYSPNTPSNTSPNTSSLSFDGSGDYVQVNSASLPVGSYTYALWVRPNAVNSTILMASDGAGNDEFKISINSSNKIVITQNNVAIITSTASVNTNGTWYHIAVVRTGTNVSLFIDGKVDGSIQNVTTASVSLNFGGCPLFIGAEPTSGCSGSIGSTFNGLIDEVSIYNRSIPRGEIQMMANFVAPAGIEGKLSLWLDGQDSSTMFTSNTCTGTAVDGNSVGCWVDKSYSGNNATNAGTSKPVLMSADANGHPALDFTSDQLTTAGVPLPRNTGYTKIVVAKVDSFGTSQNFISTNNNAAGTFYFVNSSGAIVTQNTTTGLTSAAGALNNSEYFVIATRYGAMDGLTNVINVNGVEKATSTTRVSHLSESVGLRIGAQTNNDYLDGKISEAIVYNRALSDKELDTLECSLGTKWGITVPGCSSDYVSIAQPVKYKTFQRDGSDLADIPIYGAAGGSTCTSVEASFNGGNYQTIDTELVNGTYAGTLPNQAAGQGDLVVRCANNTSVSSTVNYVGIGDVYLVAGQSNASQPGYEKQYSYHPTLKATVMKQIGSWDELQDPSDSDFYNSTGSYWPLLATQIMHETNLPVSFITTSQPGTTLVYGGTCWGKNYSGGACYQNMTNAVRDAGLASVKAVLWHQGETDADGGVSRDAYNAGLDALSVDFIEDVPGSPDLVSATIGVTGGATDARENSIRLGTQDAWNDNPKIKPGPSLYDIGPLQDGYHFTLSRELQIVANRWWASLKHLYYGGTEDGRGPRFVSAKTNTAKDKVLVTFTDSELPITPLSSVQGIDVKDNGVLKTVSSAVRVSNNQVLVSLSSAATGTVTVSNGDGDNATGTNSVNDSGSIALPAEVFIDEPATVGALPVVTATGSFTESPSTNDGTVAGSVVFNLSDDSFADPLTLNTNVSVANVPAGMEAIITRISDTQANLTLSGSASNNANTDDVDDITVTWLDGAFVTNSTASNVNGYNTPAGNINFSDGYPGGVSANLDLWLDGKDSQSLFADSACTVQARDLKGVGCWQDKAGAAQPAIQGSVARTPTYWKTNDLFSHNLAAKPSLMFYSGGEATIDYLASSQTLTGSSAYTKIVVAKIQPSALQNLVGASNQNGSTLASNGTSISMNHINNPVLTANNALNSQYAVITMRYGAGGGKSNVINVDGVQKATNSTVYGYSTFATQIGSLQAGVNSFYGNMSEALVYSTALTDAQIDSVECALGGKWGITITGCTGPSAPSTPDLQDGSDLGSDNSDNITNDNTPTFTVVCEGNYLVRIKDSINEVGSANCDSGSATITSSVLSNGVHTITATQANGTESQPSSGLSVTIDTTAPTAPNISSVGGDSTAPYHTSDTTPEFIGTSGATNSVVYVKDGDSTICSSNVGSGSWSCTSNSLSEATYNVDITQEDLAGNISSATSISLVVDETIPNDTSTPDLNDSSDSGPSNSDGVTNDNTPSFTVVCETGATVQLRAGSNVLGNGTCISSTVTITPAALGNGVHDVYARQTDPTGNTSGDSNTLSITVDTSTPAAPTLTSIGGDSSSPYNANDTTPAIIGTGENGTVVYVREGATLLCDGTVSSGNWTCDSSILSQSSHTVDITQVDQAGNTSSTVQAVLTIDASAPSFTSSVRQAPSTEITNSNTPTFRVTFSEAVLNVSDSDFTLSGTASGGANIASVTPVSALVYDVIIGGVDSADGAINLDISAGHDIVDTANNLLSSITPTGSDESYTIDNTAPSAPGVTSVTGDTSDPYSTNDNTPTLTGSGENGTTVSVKLGSITLCASVVTSSTWTCDSTQLTDNTYTINITQQDAATNVSSTTTVSIQVDALNPTATTIMRQSPATTPTNSDTPTFRVTFSESVQNVDATDFLTSGTAAGASVGVVTAVSADIYDVTINGVSNSNGTLNLAIAAGHNIKDMANKGLSTITPTGTVQNYTIDNTVPNAPGKPDLVVASDTGTTNTDNITNDSTPTFTVSCESGAAVVLRESVSQLASGTCANSTVSLTPAVMSDGIHTISAIQTDPSGNVSSTSLTLDITIDTVVPAVPGVPDMEAESDTGSSNTDNITKDNTTAFTSSCNNGEIVQMRVGNITWATGTCSGTSITLTTTAMTNGTGPMIARQTDTAGNISANSAGLTITVDTAAPAIPTVTQVGGDTTSPYATNDPTPNISGGGTAEFATVKEGSTTLCTGMVSTNTWNCTSTNLSDANHTLGITLTDVAGNESAIKSISVTTDSTPPAAPLMTALSGDTTNPFRATTQTPVIAGTGENGAIVTVKLGSTALCTAAVANNNWSCTSSMLTLATHILDVYQTDSLNNVSAHVAPTIQIMSSTVDSDSDGSNDFTELETPNNGDANGDSQMDKDQAHVRSAANAVTSGQTTLEVPTGCTLNQFVTTAAQGNSGPQNSSMNFPVGLNQFTATNCGTPGVTITIKVIYNQAYDTSNWTFVKYDETTSQYVDLSSIVTYATENIGGNNVTTVTYSIQDGSEYDLDGEANGTIVDPTGPAVFGYASNTNAKTMLLILAPMLLGTKVATVIIDKHRRRINLPKS